MQDIIDRLTLPEKLQKMLSYGLWPSTLSQPDPQVLERIQRLNMEIQENILELYLPEGQVEDSINRVKEAYHQEQKKDVKKPSKRKKTKASRGLHLGQEVSSWLNDTDERTSILNDLKLPSIPTIESLSEVLGIQLAELKWIAYHRQLTSVPLYHQFKIPKKKKGEYRTISRPIKKLDNIQTIIKRDILDKLVFPYYVFGFVPRRNIYNNAREHSKAKIIINIDIKDFFSTTNFKMVRSKFYDLGYSGQIATTLALLTTYQPYEKVSVGGKDFWACQPRRGLPQGARTSPAVSNLVLRDVDNQLFNRGKQLGYTYTRYADDLTFSTTRSGKKVEPLLYMVKRTLELHGFEANPMKTKVLYKQHQQKVTGFVVNSGNPNVTRVWRRNLRAAIHKFQYIIDQEEKQKEYSRIQGSLEFLKQSHPRLAARYRREMLRFVRDLQ